MGADEAVAVLVSAGVLALDPVVADDGCEMIATTARIATAAARLTACFMADCNGVCAGGT